MVVGVFANDVDQAGALGVMAGMLLGALGGAMVPLEQTLDGCERILAGEFKDRAERALYMIGAIDAVPQEVR